MRAVIATGVLDVVVGLCNSAKLLHTDGAAVRAVHPTTIKPNLRVLQLLLCSQFAALVSIAGHTQWLPVVVAVGCIG